MDQRPKCKSYKCKIFRKKKTCMVLGEEEFLGKMQKKCIKENINKLDFIKIKSSLQKKCKWTGKPQTGRRYFQIILKDLYPESINNS